jgi:tripartite-type tricarboxylate transporter receptor subunit TctC
MLAPAGRPAGIVDRIAKAIDEAIKSLDKLDKGGTKPTYLGPTAMREQVEKGSAMFAEIIKRGNVHL